MRGRPPKDIDGEQVMRLAALGVPVVDIAFVVGCSVDTLERRFRDQIEEGRANGRTRLRQKQLEVALSGNPAMLIWLGKQMLGQADKQDIKSEVTNKDDTVTITVGRGGRILTETADAEELPPTP